MWRKLMGRFPQPHHGLCLEAPDDEWVDGVPLGNGLLGVMAWGNGEPLRLSLDRTDLWDLTEVSEFASEDYSFSHMRRWHAEGRVSDLNRLYEEPYERPAPTRIPAGRLELALARVERIELDVARALARGTLANGGEFRLFVSAVKNVALIEIIGAPVDASRLDLRAPAFAADPDVSSLGRLGYPRPERHAGPERLGFEQVVAGHQRYAVEVGWRAGDGRTLIAISIASSADGDAPAEVARSRVMRAIERGFQAELAAHGAWWSGYWRRSSLRVPNARLERLWHRELYKFGSAARRGAPPIALQGPWTLDDGSLPPWKGDYHHDLNTELCYWPAYASNHLDEAAGFVDWLWDTRAECRAWTERFFGLPGLNVPMSADIKNRQLGGWRQYTHSSTTSAWLAQHFYLHYRYTKDRYFLRERAYPYLADVSTFLEAITRERDAKGRRTLPLSASPEIYDNKPQAWFRTITNYDNALIRFAFKATAELAEELGHDAEAARFRSLVRELPELALSEDHRLLIAKGRPLTRSHRHHSHLLALHPLGLLDPASDHRARRIANASLAEIERLGTSAWTGYSFAWIVSLWARNGDGRRAERALEIFDRAFVSRSGLHVNGDYQRLGYSDVSDRPMTLEGNFAAAEGLQQMLLQSHGGVIRVFPAVPDTWSELSFETLRAEGAFLVTAERTGGRVSRLCIESEAEGLCRVISPWSGRLLEFTMLPGEIRELTQDSRWALADSA
jgi:alpha-L-fucosidase 2